MIKSCSVENHKWNFGHYPSCRYLTTRGSNSLAPTPLVTLRFAHPPIIFEKGVHVCSPQPETFLRYYCRGPYDCEYLHGGTMPKLSAQLIIRINMQQKDRIHRSIEACAWIVLKNQNTAHSIYYLSMKHSNTFVLSGDSFDCIK